MLHFGNLTRSAGGTNDVDGDGLTDLREYQVGTDPTRTDSNFDGSTDLNDPEFVWVEDATPVGSYLNDWDTAPSAWAGLTEDTWYWWEEDFYSGFWYSAYPKSHPSDNASGIHQHWFDNGVSNMRVSTGDVLICYINIDSIHLPGEAMLQWMVRNDDNSYSWEQGLLGFE